MRATSACKQPFVNTDALAEPWPTAGSLCVDVYLQQGALLQIEVLCWDRKGRYLVSADGPEATIW